MAACGNTDETLRPAEVTSGNGIAKVSGPVIGGRVASTQSVARDDEQIVRHCARWIRLGFVNPDNLCYFNASLNLCGWAVLHHTLPLRSWLSLGACISDLVERDDSVNLSAEPVCQPLLQDWREVHVQNDVAEFIGHMLERVQLNERILGRWGSRGHGTERAYSMPLTHPIAIPLRTEQGGRGLQMQMQSPVTLQELVDEWSTQSGGQGLVYPPPEHFYLQLLRYEYRIDLGTVLKINTLVTLCSEINMPIIESASDNAARNASNSELPPTTRYMVRGFILHLGHTPRVGHYKTVLREDDGWWEKDDARPPIRYAQLSEQHRCNCYVICFSRC